MSCYTLDHIIRECMEEKGKSTARGKTQGAKNEIYHEAWRSLNMWIESRILKQKGASISGFGCFGWELKVKDGTTHSRPIFIISDLFVKNFKVKRDRVHQQPRLTSVEEVNHSLIAIKYSKVLTKDMVFSGLRDILKKLGDYVYRGYDVDVEFSFGTLFVREKRIKFEFDQTKLANVSFRLLTTAHNLSICMCVCMYTCMHLFIVQSAEYTSIVLRLLNYHRIWRRWI